MPMVTILAGGMRLISCPLKVTLPSSLSTKLEIAINEVVLPAPLEPIRVTISPSLTSKLAPASAVI